MEMNYSVDFVVKMKTKFKNTCLHYMDFYMLISLDYFDFKSKDCKDGKTDKQVFEFVQFFSLYLFCNIDEGILKVYRSSSLDDFSFFPKA